MKKIVFVACVIALTVALSHVRVDAGVYRSKVRTNCSGVAVVREYARGRAGCSGVSKVRARASCAKSRASRSCAGSL